jgi:predicted nucleic acid-binding Zn ribbon protein
MDKMPMMMPESDNRTLALVMFVAGILVWFLVDSTRPLAHDLLKAVGFFLFGWRVLSSKEKKMRILFFIIIALIIIGFILWVLIRT